VSKVLERAFDSLTLPLRARIASRMVRRPLISEPIGQFGPDVASLPSVFAHTSKSNSGFWTATRYWPLRFFSSSWM
jgi:hypothetical protein